MNEGEPTGSEKISIEQLTEEQKIARDRVQEALTHLGENNSDTVSDDRSFRWIKESVESALGKIQDNGYFEVQSDDNRQGEGVPVDHLIEALLKQIKEDGGTINDGTEDNLLNGNPNLSTLTQELDTIIQKSASSNDVKDKAALAKELIEKSFLYSEIEGRLALNEGNWRVQHEAVLLGGDNATNEALQLLKRRREVFLAAKLEAEEKGAPGAESTRRERRIKRNIDECQIRGGRVMQKIAAPGLLAATQREAYAQFNNLTEFTKMVRANIVAGIGEAMMHREATRLSNIIQRAGAKLDTLRERQNKIASAEARLLALEGLDEEVKERIREEIKKLKPKEDELANLIQLQEQYINTLDTQYSALKKATGQESAPTTATNTGQANGVAVGSGSSEGGYHGDSPGQERPRPSLRGFLWWLLGVGKPPNERSG